MKFDQKTISILKSFSGLNPSIIIKPGQVISTISNSKSVIARATTDQSFENRFAIGDLKKLLGILSLFKEPEINIFDTYMIISDGNRSVRYGFASEKVVKAPLDKEVDMSNVVVSFSLSDKTLDEIHKAMGVLSAPEVAIVGESGKISLSTFDSKNQTSDIYSIELGETDQAFRAVFSGDNWNFIPQSYEVELNPKKLARFTGKDKVNINYIVAMNPVSSNFS